MICESVRAEGTWIRWNEIDTRIKERGKERDRGNDG